MELVAVIKFEFTFSRYTAVSRCRLVAIYENRDKNYYFFKQFYYPLCNVVNYINVF